jgi:hypothetical protein
MRQKERGGRERDGERERVNKNKERDIKRIEKERVEER